MSFLNWPSSDTACVSTCTRENVHYLYKILYENNHVKTCYSFKKKKSPKISSRFWTCLKGYESFFGFK